MISVHLATRPRRPATLSLTTRVALFTFLGLWLPAPPVGASETTSSCGTPYDTIPNFAFNPTMASVQNGPWSSPATWSLGRVPQAQDVLVLRHQVTYDGTTGIADVIGIYGGASLRFRTDIATRLQVGVLEVFAGGVLEIGTPATPVATAVTAELVIRNRPLDLTTDPRQFGTGLLSHNGTVTMHGAVKAPTFVRTDVEPRAGHATVTVAQPVSGWRVGDRIFLPDTRQVPPDNWFNPNYALQVEERTIQSISADNRTITLSALLTHDHRGARDADGTPTVLANGIKLLPHVGNLTRNVIIRSENPAGTRGHTLMTLRSAVDLRYVQFQDLGRTRAEPLNSTTNHIGRYPLHMHQLWGPVNPTNTGYQFQLIGNAVNDSRKWPIAVHGSHFGLVKQNVVFGGSQLTGAGIAVEDGSETENLFEENFVANIRGDSAPRDSGPSTADGSTPGNAAECIWGAGFNNRFVNNIVSTCRNVQQQIVSGPGFKFITHAAPASTITRNPLFRGADMTNTSQTVQVTNQYQPLLEFRGNEVYGVAADGFTAWQLGTDGYDERVAQETILKDFRVWHTYEAGVYNYPANRVTLDGYVFRVDLNPTHSWHWPDAYRNGDYRIIDLTIRNADIHGGSIFQGGDSTDPIRNFLFENNRATTRYHAFTFRTPETPGTGAGRPASGVVMTLRNNVITSWPGQPLQTIEMNHDLSTGNSQPDDRYDVYVYDYQGQAGNNFRAYFSVQATQNLYGGLAPCNDTTSRPEVAGITCPLTGGPATLSIADTSVTESDLATVQATFTVSRSGATATTATVSYSAVAGTATAGADFAAVSGTLTFPPGTATRTLVVPVLGDTLDEDDETFLVNLSAPSGATLNDGQATGTILDNDPLPGLSVDDCAVTEGDAGPTPCGFTIRLLPASGRSVTVSYDTQNGTATAGSDYTAVAGALTWAPGATVQPVPVNVIGDTAIEPDETFVVRLLAPGNATLADAQGDATIQDDDATALSSLELTHGSRLSADLFAGTPDFYRIGQAPRASYEVVLDGVSGDAVPGLELARLAADNATVLQSAAVVGAGSAVALRWENNSAAPVTSQHLRVSGAACGSTCGADDVYRLRAYETTATIPRFNNSGSQVSVVLLQNRTPSPVSGRLLFWGPGGGLLATHPFTMNARASLVLNTSAVPGLAGQSGSVTLAHDGGYGALAGKAVALEPSTGYSFDSPLAARPR